MGVAVAGPVASFGDHRSVWGVRLFGGVFSKNKIDRISCDRCNNHFSKKKPKNQRRCIVLGKDDRDRFIRGRNKNREKRSERNAPPGIKRGRDDRETALGHAPKERSQKRRRAHPVADLLSDERFRFVFKNLKRDIDPQKQGHHRERVFESVQ